MNLELNGLIVYPIKDKKFLDILTSTLQESIKVLDLAELHNSIERDQLNNLRILSFQKINSLVNWEYEFFKLIDDHIESLLGPDLLIQRKLNLSIQIPEDKTSILSIHSDTLSGQSPFEIVVWLPITAAFQSNAMFYFDVETSNLIREDMLLNEEMGLDFLRNKYWHKHKILNINPGEIALFTSTIFHGNILNQTNKTRISINCRFKNLYSPETIQTPNERGVGMFYKLLKYSPLTKLALDYSFKEDKFK
jgi:sporadic carbohydrate cluster 2OG-Fe(II) oxygenase